MANVSPPHGKRAASVAATPCASRAISDVQEVAIVGDLNVDSKWGKDSTREHQREAVQSAPLGAMPQELVDAGPGKIAAQLDGKLDSFPEFRCFTSLKERTCFQGQPDKTGELILAHKDCVLLPKGGLYAVEAPGDCLVAGIDKRFTSNLEMLMPSCDWPSDHLAVLCAAKPTQSLEASKTIARTVVYRT